MHWNIHARGDDGVVVVYAVLIYRIDRSIVNIPNGGMTAGRKEAS